MALLGFSHVGICVRDIDRSRRFYCEVLGFGELYAMDLANDEVAATMEQSGAFRSAMLLRGDLRIELLQWVDVPITGDGERKPMTQLGFTHLSFRVDDVDELTGKVEACGGQVLPHTLTVVGVESDPGAATHLMYVLDPDGTRIELMSGVPDLSEFSAEDVAALANGLETQ